MQMQHDDFFIVDNFAGGGGASTGIHLGLGVHPDFAINHDEMALAMHKANHPETKHLINDVWDIDPEEVAGGRIVDLAWFSPDCRHHSKAKGGKPVSKSVRDLAWVVVKWAKLVRPRIIMLENVEEFQLWGPLTDEQKPCPNRAGQTFKSWVAALRDHGYEVEWKELRACDYGAPTIRKRLFVIARCDGEQITWPEPTHGSGKIPYKTAADIIDWSVPVPSIFDTSEEIKEKFGVRAKRPLADNTLARIARGVDKFILQNEEPFFISYAQHGGRNRSASDPLHTITASKKDQNCLVVPTLVQTGYGERKGQAPRCLNIQEPLGTVVAGGSKHALVTAFMAQHNTGVVGRPVDEPLSTLTTRGTQQNVVCAHMLSLHGSSRRATDMDQPISTITAGGGHAALVTAMMVKYYGTAIGQPCNEPLHSVTTKGRFGLVTVNIDGQTYAITDIGMRMLTPREQFRAQGFSDDYEIEKTPCGKSIPKTQQTHKCGNSVPPPVVAALVSANLNNSENNYAIEA